MKTKTRLTTTLAPYLKEKLEQFAEKFGCSQAEVIRTALIRLMEVEK
jgi:hypothetical protein